MKEGLISSINAAYTAREIEDILAKTEIENYKVYKNLIGLGTISQKR